MQRSIKHLVSSKTHQLPLLLPIGKCCSTLAAHWNHLGIKKSWCLGLISRESDLIDQGCGLATKYFKAPHLILMCAIVENHCSRALIGPSLDLRGQISHGQVPSYPPWGTLFWTSGTSWWLEQKESLCTSKRARVCRMTSAGGVVRTKWGWAWSAGATEDLREAYAHWWGISEWIFLLNKTIGIIFPSEWPILHVQVAEKLNGKASGAVLILVTSGHDEHISNCLLTVLSRGSTIHTIALGASADKNLEELSQRTGKWIPRNLCFRAFPFNLNIQSTTVKPDYVNRIHGWIEKNTNRFLKEKYTRIVAKSCLNFAEYFFPILLRRWQLYSSNENIFYNFFVKLAWACMIMELKICLRWNALTSMIKTHVIL